MRNEENICQYCARQRPITTLSLNAFLNKMYQELSQLLIVSGLLNITLCYIVQIIRNTKLQVLTLPGYVFYLLTALYFRISIGIFCNLFICLVFDVLLQSIYFRMFCSKHSVTFDTYLLSCYFTVMTYFTSVLDPVKLPR